MLTAERENLLAVMGLLGSTDEAVAAEKLACRVFLNVADDSSAIAFAEDLTKLLERSLSLVPDTECDVEVAIGAKFKSSARSRIHIMLTPAALTIALGREQGSVEEGIHGLFRKIAACYAAGNVIARAVGGPRFEHLPDPFQVKLSAFGISSDDLRRPIVLTDSVVAGAGGVANGFLWGAAELNLAGNLTVCDPKNVSTGNLNRCLFFGTDDVDNKKAEVLAERTSTLRFDVKPFIGTFADLVKMRGKVRRIFTTVDSRPARRAIQGELPIEVLDASTTDLSAVVVHSHCQPNDGACLACIYAHIPAEEQRLKHVAEGLGITIDETRASFINEELATKLASIHPGLNAPTLVGTSLDTLYKEQCGQGALLTAAGKQAIAPLAFISALAGVLLAVELVRFEQRATDNLDSAYLSLDPWMPPTMHARRRPKRNPNCEFCSNSASFEAMRLVWPDLVWKGTGK